MVAVTRCGQQVGPDLGWGVDQMEQGPDGGGGWGPYLNPIPFLVPILLASTPSPYLVPHPPIFLSRIVGTSGVISVSGTPSQIVGTSTLTSLQSGILHSLIFGN